ncbi:MAG: ElyC/SanA/YdcF family protein [Nitrospira sp.]|nr:ElyC/SanA/YdcF family protein [Nitrospira sp.]
MTIPWSARSAGLVFFVFATFLSFAATSCCTERGLTVEHTIHPSKTRDALPERSPAVAYVLGGTEASLEKRFLLASALYREGTVAKVLFLSRPGKTRYSQDLGRNLTNDEWAARHLADLGLPSGDLEPIVVPPRIFGTLGEAETVIEVTRLRGYQSLILVTSSSHTQRVWQTFTSLAAGQDVSLYIYAANDQVGASALIWECLKLGVYKIFLI